MLSSQEVLAILTTVLPGPPCLLLQAQPALGPELFPACISSLKSMGPTPHTHPLSCSSSTLYSPKPNHAATRPFPVWGPVSGMQKACLSSRGAHTIRLLAFSSPQCGITGISKPGCCSPGPPALPRAFLQSYPITSTAWSSPAPFLCLTSSHLPLSSHQPALSFTQSHLFRNSLQHSALYPQISPQQLTQCLGVFAAATVAGFPGQLNKVAWHQLAGVAYDGRFAIRALKTFAVSYVCTSRDMCTQHP